MLPEDDRVIETCRSVLKCFNVNFRLLKTIYVHLLVCCLNKLKNASCKDKDVYICVVFINLSCWRKEPTASFLPLNLLNWKIRWAPNNASKWQMGFNSAFKGLKCPLTFILLTWRIWWAPNNASRWQMGFNSSFKGLKCPLTLILLTWRIWWAPNNASKCRWDLTWRLKG